MKKLIIYYFTLCSLISYSQWNNGTIAFNQVRSNLEFVDSIIVISGGHSCNWWDKCCYHSVIAFIWYFSGQSTIIAMNKPRLEPIMVGDSGIYIIGGVSNWADVNGNDSSRKHNGDLQGWQFHPNSIYLVLLMDMQ